MDIEDIENELGIGIEIIPITDEKNIEILETRQESVRTILNETQINFDSSDQQINPVKCFWCRNNFSGEVFSIPVRYNPSHYPVPNGTAETKSFVEKEVSVAERKMMQAESIPVVVEENFDLDGIFCSGECRQAFLESNIQDPIYKDSIALLKMYDGNKYVPAMSWRTLSDYGGNLSIDEFRNINSAKKTEYRENPLNIGERYLERDFI
jgi:hypothetical protein